MEVLRRRGRLGRFSEVCFQDGRVRVRQGRTGWGNDKHEHEHEQHVVFFLRRHIYVLNVTTTSQRASNMASSTCHRGARRYNSLLLLFRQPPPLGSTCLRFTLLRCFATCQPTYRRRREVVVGVASVAMQVAPRHATQEADALWRFTSMPTMLLRTCVVQTGMCSSMNVFYLAA